jgi:hypothetical protein
MPEVYRRLPHNRDAETSADRYHPAHDDGVDELVVQVNPEVASLTTEQQAVLQAVYDYFHEHAAWPTFITIDRPLRRQHDWDTAAIVLTLPEALIVPPHPGRLRPVESDELRLRLPGIQACRGGSEDTERFVRLLRWLAEREIAYEPQPGSGDEMPRVTSAEVGQYLGLGDVDQLALKRLLLMLQLGNWGLGASGSSEDSWFVMLRPDIWRFRNVQTVEDCMEAWGAWASEGRPPAPAKDSSTQASYYHVRISVKSDPANGLDRLDLSREELESQFLTPYREGRSIVTDGAEVRIDDISQIRIMQTDRSSVALRSRSGSLIGRINDSTLTGWGRVATSGADVTNDFITEPPGQPITQPTVVVAHPPPSPAPSPYVNKQIVAAIRAKDGQSTFNVTKLLGLIDELNDNYGNRNTYASHALLRALLDHIPPILRCADFKAVFNTHSWGRTDKNYIKRLLAFRDQADDALHRQISAKADVLDFDDMPASVCVDRLLQECAEHL